MAQQTFVRIAELPDPVRAALKSVDYGRADIAVEVATEVVLSSSGGKGSRAFASLVNLATGQHVTSWGSWGGQNPFTPGNAVDNDSNAYPLPPEGVAIRGSVGGGRPTYAVIVVPASMTDRILPAPPAELTKAERDALYCFACIKGGQYRRDELARRRVAPATVDAMVERGYVKRNAAGAGSITTEGRNAMGDYRGY